MSVTAAGDGDVRDGKWKDETKDPQPCRSNIDSYQPHKQHDNRPAPIAIAGDDETPPSYCFGSLKLELTLHSCLPGTTPSLSVNSTINNGDSVRLKGSLRDMDVRQAMHDHGLERHCSSQVRGTNRCFC